MATDRAPGLFDPVETWVAYGEARAEAEFGLRAPPPPFPAPAIPTSFRYQRTRWER